MGKAKLLLGTTNRGKVRELAEMLGDLDVEVTSLAELGPFAEVDETGATFAENARLKAAAYANYFQLPTLADDSGFEVEALDWRPGVHSARYGGAAASTFAEKITLLLNEMRASGRSTRSARFKCAVTFASPDGAIIAETEGIVRGRVAEFPRGKNGFGYDPIFIPDGHSHTFAELSSGEKGRLSHRGRALLQIIPYLRRFFGTLT
ncbi:MAG TPA: RdgB/HAM1 family non-canonical purine NTP pyrophosphatase [Pyrinomonadaceae bacterium]|nr:RdgB/HAM1 family non-canonical purine NTP pyrophosphatase [Pyrinomonadaceae bacterium]